MSEGLPDDVPWPGLLHGQDRLRERLVTAYSAPGREYHDLRHLREVIGHVRDLAKDCPSVDVDVVVAAAWFHDAVYDGDRDDEDRSAAWAESALRDAGVAAGTVDEVVRLVHLTKTHTPEPDDLAGTLLSDADMAILGASPERYGEYVAGVRREYAHLGDDDFRTGRSAVLRELLDRSAIFGSDEGRRRWEDRARTNIRRELQSLTTVDELSEVRRS